MTQAIMKAAVVEAFGSPPRYGEFVVPTPEPEENIVTVHAAALSQLVRGQASGRHYSSGGALPFIPGVDGVGTLPDGRRVYFAFPRSPYGAMAERVPVRSAFCVPLPDGLDDVTAAAIANPGMSSWAALTVRAKLIGGETVLVNGATGSAGRLAVQIAKHLGAARVIATGRHPAKLEALRDLGADAVIPLGEADEALTQRFRQEIGSVDVVLDYLWGASAERLLAAISGVERRIRYVQIGAISGPTISFPAAVLRSSKLEMLGSGLGSVSNPDLIAAIGALMNAAVPAGLTIETEAVPLADVEEAWSRDTGERRLVFTLGPR